MAAVNLVLDFFFCIKNDRSVQCFTVQHVSLAYKCAPLLDAYQGLEMGLQKLNKEQYVLWLAFTDECDLG